MSAARKTRDQLTRAEIITMLRSFANERPGLEFGNYGDIVAYRADQRRCAQQKSDALHLLRSVELSESSIDRATIAAALTNGGRLELLENGALYYCAGQYYPMEYRASVARLCGGLLWTAERVAHPSIDGCSIRKRFRDQYGRGLAARWFS